MSKAGKYTVKASSWWNREIIEVEDTTHITISEDRPPILNRASIFTYRGGAGGLPHPPRSKCRRGGASNSPN
ncbi:MAG: hypothetical protein QXE79_04320 [Candidatus Bathyarchaeia archaeon]